jgi:hypothetical protein
MKQAFILKLFLCSKFIIEKGKKKEKKGKEKEKGKVKWFARNDSLFD